MSNSGNNCVSTLGKCEIEQNCKLYISFWYLAELTVTVDVRGCRNKFGMTVKKTGLLRILTNARKDSSTVAQ